MTTPKYVGPSTYTVTFGKALMRAIGAPWTPANDAFLRAWAQGESAAAKNNPFAATRPMPGSTTTYNPNGSLNTKHVQDYLTWEQGVEASARTLLSTTVAYKYGPIVAALRSGTSALVTARALAASSWGTGQHAVNILTNGGPRAFPIGACYPKVPTAFTRTIKPGMTGADVDELLRRLGNTSTFYQDTLDEYGPVAKVKAVQRSSFPWLGLPDGIVGPKTFRKITNHA
jgi:hypothetical protein